MQYTRLHHGGARMQWVGGGVTRAHLYEHADPVEFYKISFCTVKIQYVAMCNCVRDYSLSQAAHRQCVFNLKGVC